MPHRNPLGHPARPANCPAGRGDSSTPMNQRRSASSAQRVKTSSNWSTTNDQTLLDTITGGFRGTVSAYWAGDSWPVRSMRAVVASDSAGDAVGVTRIRASRSIPLPAAGHRARAGNTPAASSDDVPDPDGPMTTSGPRSGAGESSRSHTVAIIRSRPKNHFVDSGPNGARPGYGHSDLSPVPDSVRTTPSAQPDILISPRHEGDRSLIQRRWSRIGRPARRLMEVPQSGYSSPFRSP